MKIFYGMIAAAFVFASCGQVSNPASDTVRDVHPWLVWEDGMSFETVCPVKDMIGSLSVLGDPPQAFIDECHRNGIEVYKCVQGKSSDMDTPEKRDSLYNMYMNCCKSGYDGIDFDYEGFDPSFRDTYCGFLTEAAARIHAAGKKVNHCVGFYQNMYDDSDAVMFYDPKVLDEVCDMIRIMCYDMYWAPGNNGEAAPSCFGPTSHYAWAKLAVRYWKERVSPDKLVMALPAYGNDYAVEPGLKGVQIYSSVPDSVKGDLPKPVWLYYERLYLYLYDHTDGKKHVFYASDERSTAALLELADEMGISRIGFWHFGSISDEMWSVVQKWCDKTDSTLP